MGAAISAARCSKLLLGHGRLLLFTRRMVAGGVFVLGSSRLGPSRKAARLHPAVAFFSLRRLDPEVKKKMTEI